MRTLSWKQLKNFAKIKKILEIFEIFKKIFNLL